MFYHFRFAKKKNLLSKNIVRTPRIWLGGWQLLFNDLLWPGCQPSRLKLRGTYDEQRLGQKLKSRLRFSIKTKSDFQKTNFDFQKTNSAFQKTNSYFPIETNSDQALTSMSLKGFRTKTLSKHLKTKTKKTKTKPDSVDHHALLEDQYGGSRCPFGGVRLCWRC